MAALFVRRTATSSARLLRNQYVSSRGYASEMSFTFASPSEVWV